MPCHVLQRYRSTFFFLSVDEVVAVTQINPQWFLQVYTY